MAAAFATLLRVGGVEFFGWGWLFVDEELENGMERCSARNNDPVVPLPDSCELFLDVAVASEAFLDARSFFASSVSAFAEPALGSTLAFLGTNSVSSLSSSSSTIAGHLSGLVAWTLDPFCVLKRRFKD